LPVTIDGSIALIVIGAILRYTAGQLGVHRVLEGIELPVGVARRRCS
jgi:hypothetical protein